MQQNKQKNSFFTARPLLMALFFFLPILLPGFIGWLNALLAVPIFLLLQTATDEQKAAVEIRNGLLMAGLGSLLIGRFSMFLFTLIMLPVGYSLHHSAVQQKNPAQAGIAGIITLSIAWLFFWTGYSVLSGTPHPYTGLLTSLDAFLEQIIIVYRTNGELPVDVLYRLELLITEMRELLPKILPGLLAGTVVLTVTLNMIISRVLLRRLAPEKVFWPPYKEWQLPDKTIWFLIFSFVLLLINSGQGKTVGLSLVCVAGLLYFLQGVAVVMHTLNRWNLPRAFRLFAYVFLGLQRYGVLLVIIIGIADTWANFRKLDHTEKDTTE
ncbi:MAG: DUF2232 domain-containing protein [Candidatus Electrothrix sp. AU1_5]|nr:DUF2232 domain-containing protein [Candidatus Electrothrix gigas]